MKLQTLSVAAVSLLLIGAGCSSAKPKDTSYVGDAAGFSADGSQTILSSSSPYQAPQPAPISPLPGTVGATSSVTAPKIGLLPPPIKAAPSTSTAISSNDQYVKGVEVYKKTGFYMQFTNCQAAPGSLVVKKGTKVMFDNHEDKGHTLGYEGRLYGLGSYRYVVVTASKIGVNYITCDGGGAGQLTVQP